MSTTAVATGGGNEGHGRLKGRSPAEIVRNSGLPPELGDVVLAVTGRTRLWPRERVEVARELCGHFLDGLEADQAPHELVELFGDPRTAARLITRAKKRNRPMAWRGLKLAAQGVGVLLALAAAWYGWSVARFYSGTPTIRFNVQSEMNAAALATPLSERGWPLYRDAHRALRKSGFFVETGSIDEWPRVEPGTPKWTAACAAHDKVKAEIERIRRGTRAQRAAYVIQSDPGDHAIHFGAPTGEEPAPNENPVGLGVLLPQLAVFRSHARVLAFEVRRAAEEGRAGDAAADVERMLRLAHHASEDGTLIGQLVEIAIAQLAFDSLNAAVRDHPSLLSDAHLQRLAHVVGGYAPSPEGRTNAWRPDMRFERRVFEDLLQRFYTDDGEGDGRLCRGVMDYTREFGAHEPKSAKFIQPVLGGVVAGRSEMLAAYERLMSRFEAEIAKPLYLRDQQALYDEMDSLKGSLGIRNSLAVIMAPHELRITQGFDVGRMTRDATAAGLAAELYARRTGKPPAAWSDLVPSLLPSVPVDPWSGRALGFKAGAAAGGRPLIYSVGADRVDDGGVVGTAADVTAALRARASGGTVPTWDWVVWPLGDSSAAPPLGAATEAKERKTLYKWGWVGSLTGGM